MSRIRAIPRRSFRAYGFAAAGGLFLAGEHGAGLVIFAACLALAPFLE